MPANASVVFRAGHLASSSQSPYGQMMDSLHSTAFQTLSRGNSLGNALEGTAESIAEVTVDDVASVLAGVVGSDVVVAGTGGGMTHDELVEKAGVAYGELPGVGTRREVGKRVEPAPFIGSDMRCVASSAQCECSVRVRGGLECASKQGRTIRSAATAHRARRNRRDEHPFLI